MRRSRQETGQRRSGGGAVAEIAQRARGRGNMELARFDVRFQKRNLLDGVHIHNGGSFLALLHECVHRLGLLKGHPGGARIAAFEQGQPEHQDIYALIGLAGVAERSRDAAGFVLGVPGLMPGAEGSLDDAGGFAPSVCQTNRGRAREPSVPAKQRRSSRPRTTGIQGVEGQK